MNIYMFPSAEEIVSRLMSVDDTGGDVTRVYNRFAESMANSEKGATGVVMGFGMAIHHVATEPMATPMLGALMHLRFDEFATALFPDAPDFAAEAIEFHSLVMNDTK